jgi:hypothetical protein
MTVSAKQCVERAVSDTRDYQRSDESSQHHTPVINTKFRQQ